jgi:hypothetical protein
LWSYSEGDAQTDQARDVAVDPWNNVVVAGVLSKLASKQDVLVAKYGANGPVWSQAHEFDEAQLANGVAVDSAGNIVVVGEFDNVLDFGGAPLVSAGGADIFVTKLDPDGNHLWSQRFGDGDEQAADTVAVDSAGNIVLGGHFEGSVDFGGGTLTSAGGQDGFVAKLSANGAHEWSLRVGDQDTQQVDDIAVDAADNVVVAIQAAGTVDLGGGPVTSYDAVDVVVAKFTPDGSHIWTERFGGPGNQFVNAVAVDPAGNVVIVGDFTCQTDFGGGTLTSAGALDVFLAKLTP